MSAYIFNYNIIIENFSNLNNLNFVDVKVKSRDLKSHIFNLQIYYRDFILSFRAYIIFNKYYQ